MKIENKYIKLGKSYIEDGKIKVVIEEQSHICKEFGNKTRVDYRDGTHPEKISSETMFKASNGVTLLSSAYPSSNYRWGDGVFVRGRYKSENTTPLEFDSLERYNKFVEAVNEYNEYFSKPQVKEVTMADLEKLLGYTVKIKK